MILLDSPTAGKQFTGLFSDLPFESHPTKKSRYPKGYLDFLVREMGLEPVYTAAKTAAALRGINWRSSFRSSFGVEVEKLLEYLTLVMDVLLADLSVNFTHCGYV